MTAPHKDESSVSKPSSDEEQVKLNPWLIGLGVVALLVGLLAGLVMSHSMMWK